MKLFPHLYHHVTYRLYLLNPELKVDISWSVVGGLSMIHNIQLVPSEHLALTCQLLKVFND